MRLLILSLVLANAALMNAIDPVLAQSPTTYPWCSRSGDRNNTNNCYFRSKEECQRTTAGIGSMCLPNPYVQQSPQGRSTGRRSSGRAYGTEVR